MLNLPQFELPYSRNVKKNCQICKNQFGIFNKQHICKRCFRSVCDICSPYKVRCYKSDRKHRLHRKCAKCNTETEIFKQYIDNNHLIWNSNSDLTNFWFKQLKSQNFNSMKQISMRKININKMNLKKIVDVDDLWKSLNYSFRQFIGIVLDASQLKEEHIMDQLNYLIGQIERISQLGMMNLQSIVYIGLFFLCHAKLDHAVYFTEYLINFLPKENERYQFNQQLSKNIQQYLDKLGCSEIEVYKISQYLDDNIDTFINSFTLNVFTGQMSLQIINRIFSKSLIQQLAKGIAYALYERKQFVCKNIFESNKIVVDMLKNITTSHFRQILKILDQTDKKKRKCGSKNGRALSQISVVTQSQYVSLLRTNQQLKEKNRQQEKKVEHLKKENKLLTQQINKKNNNKSFDEEPIDTYGDMSFFVDQENNPRDDQIQQKQVNPKVKAKMMKLIQFHYQQYDNKKQFASCMNQLKKINFQKKTKENKNLVRNNHQYEQKKQLNEDKHPQRLSQYKNNKYNNFIQVIKPENSLQIIQKKNEQISQLQKAIQYENNILNNFRKKTNEFNQSKRNQKPEFDTQISELRLKVEYITGNNNGLKQMNKKMIVKLDELTNLLQKSEKKSQKNDQNGDIVSEKSSKSSNSESSKKTQKRI